VVERFKTEDIGKRVTVQFDPKTNLLAQMLGASEVSASGKIVEVGSDYFKLEIMSPHPFQRKRVKQYEYKNVLYYQIQS